MPGKVALASGDFDSALTRQDQVKSGTLSHYDLVCLFRPPRHWMVRYVADFTSFPAGLEANIKLRKAVRCKPFTISFREDPQNKFQVFFFGRFEYGR